MRPYLVVTTTSFSYMALSLRSGDGSGAEPRAKPLRCHAVLLLPPLEHRFALFAPGFKRFGVVGRGDTFGAQPVVRGDVEAGAGDVVERALQPGDGERRVGGKGGGKRIDPRHQHPLGRDL